MCAYACALEHTEEQPITLYYHCSPVMAQQNGGKMNYGGIVFLTAILKRN